LNATERELIARLRDAIADEAIRSLGLSPLGWPGRLLAPALRPVTTRFALHFADFDRDVAQLGFSTAARRLLSHYVQGRHAHGIECVPDAGPLLVVSNHPGATDGLAIAASLPRDDLWILLSDVPFTRALPCARDHAIYVSGELAARARATREMIRHLGSGDAVLIFPSGHLDPDPATMRGAEQGLADWSRSLALILRRVPQARLLVAIVGGVLDPRFLSHPLTWIGPKGWRRQKLAEAIQIIHQLLFRTPLPLTVRITFGQPLSPGQLRQQNGPADLERAVVAHAHRVMALHLAEKTGPVCAV
jgi:1-acyl-sn-glycerol-3-phosphate acyltransferase